MVVIKFEIWPHGDETKARPLGRIDIVNDGTGSSKSGNYEVRIHHMPSFSNKRNGYYRVGRVTGFMRNLSVYHLLHKALDSIFKKQ